MSLSPLPTSVPIHSVDLDQEELDRLLDQLDEAALPYESAEPDRRTHDRKRCRTTMVLVAVTQEGVEEHFAIPVRNVSPGGISFLHRSALQRGSPCFVRISLAGGRWCQTTGKVARCWHVTGTVYEIGLQFYQTMDTSRLPADADES
ncbi:MAG: PilZ domain-containing protein [Planctomycetota bacterium]